MLIIKFSVDEKWDQLKAKKTGKTIRIVLSYIGKLVLKIKWVLPTLAIFWIATLNTSLTTTFIMIKDTIIWWYLCHDTYQDDQTIPIDLISQSQYFTRYSIDFTDQYSLWYKKQSSLLIPLSEKYLMVPIHLAYLGMWWYYLSIVGRCGWPVIERIIWGLVPTDCLIGWPSTMQAPLPIVLDGNLHNDPLLIALSPHAMAKCDILYGHLQLPGLNNICMVL